MQINKVLKGLILVLPIIMSMACSSKKVNDKIVTENNLVDKNPSTPISTDQVVVPQKTQELQHNQELQNNQELQKNNVIYFPFNKDNVDPEYIKIFDQHADFLRSNPSVKITVEGHSDKRGTPEYNIALGKRRANAVKMYLQSKGVNDEQIAIVSYGKEKPIAMGNDETAHAKNRRAVLVY